MKMIKKNWMVVALAMVLTALTFAACSSDDDEIIPPYIDTCSVITDAYQIDYFLRNEKGEVTTTFKEGENIIFHVKITNKTGNTIHLADSRDVLKGIMSVYNSNGEYVGNPWEKDFFTLELRWLEVGKDGLEWSCPWGLFSNSVDMSSIEIHSNFTPTNPLPEGNYYCMMKSRILKRITADNSSGFDDVEVRIPFVVGSGHGEAKEIAAVAGEEIYDKWRKPQQETTDPLALFFRDELHGPYWDNNNIEHKTFFNHGNYDEERVLIINSREEFQSAYMGTNTLPEVDFSRYTLVLGRTWGNDTSCFLDKIILRDTSAYYELDAKLLHYVDIGAYSVVVNIYYWRLYPKLEKKNIIPKRSVMDVKGEIEEKK